MARVCARGGSQRGAYITGGRQRIQRYDRKAVRGSPINFLTGRILAHMALRVSLALSAALFLDTGSACSNLLISKEASADGSSMISYNAGVDKTLTAQMI